MPFPSCRLPLAVVLIALWSACGTARADGPSAVPSPPAPLDLDPLPITPGRHSATARVRLDGRPVDLHFDLTLPAASDGTRGLPLVVSLTDPPPAAAPPFACLVPQCPAGLTWADPSADDALRQLIDRLVDDAHLDPGRVYLIGTGSADAWRLGTALAGRLAGVAAIRAAAPADPAAAVAGLWHVAVYAVADRADDPMLVALAALPHRDFSARIEPAADAAAVSADPAFWGWLFAQTRSADTAAPPAARRDVHLGRPTTVPSANADVSVSVDLNALPTTAGFSVVPATLRLNGRTLPFDFGLYLPPGYPRAVGYGGGPVPTVVNLHWREFFGGADAQVIAETLPKLLVRTPNEEKHTGERPADPVPLTHVAPIVCIMPHCPADCRFERTPGMAEAVGRLLDQVVPALHADPDRVFVTGVSYGGTSSWLVAERNPGRFAGVVACDGRRTADPAATAAALRDAAVYISAGDRDGDFTNDGRRMVAALVDAGHPDVTYREIHGGGHFCFSSTYTDPAFWAWLQSRHRPAAATLAAAPTTPPPVLLASTVGTTPPPSTRPAAPPATRPTPAAVPPPPDTSFTLDPATLPTAPGPHVVRAAVRLNGRPVRFRFWLYLPAGYDAYKPQAWPVVVALHNRGFIGGDGNGSLTGEGLPFLLTHDRPDPRWHGNAPADPVDLQHAAPFVCVAPQCPTAHTFDDPGMLAVIDQMTAAVVASCHGDPARTYLTGFSYGASNTWLVAAGLPERFAAIAPVDGRATPDPAATVGRLKHTSVYQVVGGRDDEFLPEAKRMVTALAAGPHPDFAFHVVPGGNHFCYGSVYTDPAFWTWMFARRRGGLVAAAHEATASPPPPPPPRPYAGRVVVLMSAASLPTKPGYAVVRPAVGVGGRPLSVPVGIWLPPAFRPGGGPLPVILSLHNRYAIGMDGSDNGLLGEGLPMILTRRRPRHRRRHARPPGSPRRRRGVHRRLPPVPGRPGVGVGPHAGGPRQGAGRRLGRVRAHGGRPRPRLRHRLELRRVLHVGPGHGLPEPVRRDRHQRRPGVGRPGPHGRPPARRRRLPGRRRPGRRVRRRGAADARRPDRRPPPQLRPAGRAPRRPRVVHRRLRRPRLLGLAHGTATPPGRRGALSRDDRFRQRRLGVACAVAARGGEPCRAENARANPERVWRVSTPLPSVAPPRKMTPGWRGTAGRNRSRCMSVRGASMLVVLLAVGTYVTVAGIGCMDSAAHGGPAPATAGGNRPFATTRTAGLPLRGVAMQIQRVDWIDKYEQSCDEIADDGADTVLLVVEGRQENGGSNHIYLDMRMTPTPEKLGELIDHAKRRHLRVVLMPIVLLDDPRNDTEWRGTLKPDSWDEWFDSYREMLTQFAWIAQGHGVDVMSVGSELVSAEPKLDQWTKTIAKVREVFHGSLTYSANWDHYNTIPFWDQLDLIGMNSYYTLGDGPDAGVDEIEGRWRKIQKDLHQFQAKVGKPLFFVEAGWCSLDNAASAPWDYTQTQLPANDELQKRLYEAFFHVWYGDPQLGGFMVWEWPPGPPDDRGYTPKGKPAEGVLKSWMARKPWAVR